MRYSDIESDIVARKSPEIVLTLTTEAGVWRVGGKAFTVPAEEEPDGFMAIEAGMLQRVAFQDEFDPNDLSSLASLQQAGVQVVLEPHPIESASDLLVLLGGSAELALCWESQDWALRRKLLTGSLQGLSFGLPGEPISFTLENTPPTTSGIVGDDTVDLGEYFTNPVDSLSVDLSSPDGRHPPIVFGRAKRIPGYKIGDDGAGNNQLFLCLHELPAGDIRTYEDGADDSTRTPVAVSGSIGVFRVLKSASLYSAAHGGYTWDADNGGWRGSKNAADVLKLLLELSGLKVDEERMIRTYNRLRSWDIGLYVDSQASAIEIIRERLLKFLPLVEVNGDGGIWFAYFDGLNEPAVVDLSTGGKGLIGRIGAAETSDLDEVRNSWTIAYQYDSFTGTYLKNLSLGWRTRDATGARVAYDESCLVSKRLFGPKESDILECPIIWDTPTAQRLLKLMCERYALPRIRVSYLYDPIVCYTLELGDIVSYTDTELGLSALKAVVTRIDRTLQPPQLTLELLTPSPARF